MCVFAGLFQSTELASPPQKILDFQMQPPKKLDKKLSTLVGSFQLLTSPHSHDLVMEFEGEHWG